MKPAYLIRAAAAGLLVAAACACAAAQTRGAAAPAPAQSARPAGPSADENFELNIVSRRITEGDFRAETAVEAGAERGLRLMVGVALGASDIDALLLGVRGRVRFRGSLAPLLRLLDARRGPAADAPAPEKPSP